MFVPVKQFISLFFICIISLNPDSHPLREFYPPVTDEESEVREVHLFAHVLELGFESGYF